MISFLQKNKISIIIVTLFLGIYGAMSVFTIPKETQPSISIPYYSISVAYPWADPSTIDEQVINKLDQKLKSISLVDKITSTSYYNFWSIVIQFNEAKRDVDAINDIKSAIDQVYSTFPTDVKYPVSRKISINDTPVYSFSVAWEYPTQIIYEQIRDLEDKIKSVPGVSDLTVIGKPVKQIKISFDAERISLLELDLWMIIPQLKSAFIKFPADKKEINWELYSFEVINYDENLTWLIDQIKNYDIFSKDGKYIKIQDVAKVELSYKKNDKKSFLVSDISKKSARNALSFQVTKSPWYSLEIFVNNLQTQVREFSKSHPDLQFVETMSQKESIQRIYNLFIENFYETWLLVFLIILVFLWARSSMAILISFLVVYLTNFAYLKAIWYSFNNIVSFALILVLWIMIDNLIVIAQWIVVWLQKFNNDIWLAIQDSLKNYARPVIFGTLTTIAVFVPLYFWLSWIIGSYIRPMPVTIIANLLISLFVTMIILPVISTFFFSKWMKFKQPAALSFLDRTAKKFARWYYRLNRGKGWSRMVVFSFLLFFVLSFLLFAFGIVKFEFMWNIDSDNIWINAKYEPWIAIDQNQQNTAKIANDVFDYFNQNYKWLVKYISIDLWSEYSLHWWGQWWNNVSTFTIRLVKWVDRNIKSYQIVENLQKFLSSDIKNKYNFLKDIFVFTMQAWWGSGKPISFDIVGEDYQQINNYIQQILPAIKNINGVYNVSTSIQYTNWKIKYVLDENRAKQLWISNMSTLMMIMWIQNSDYEPNGIKIKDFSEFWNDSLSLNVFINVSGNNIDNLKIWKIYLWEVVKEKKLEAEDNSISRIDGEKTISVQADKKTNVALSDITTQINQVIQDNPLPNWLKYKSGWDIASQAQSMSDLWTAMAIGLLLMLLILIVQFNNIKYALVIVSSVFLSIWWSIVILALTGYDMTFPAMIWLFGVLWVWVNQALIHIEDFKIFYEEQGMSVRDSFKLSIADRFVPIVLTKLTTITGLLILAFKDELFWSMAIAFIGWLIVSFFVTLMYIPSLMNLLIRHHNKKYEKEHENNWELKIED